MNRLSEFDVIEQFFAPLSSSYGLGLLDDVALLPSISEFGYERIITNDALIADVHFFSGDSPVSVARKALAVNISDIISKGAEPEGFLMSLAVPRAFSQLWIEEFAKGLKQAIDEWQCPLFGGDTVVTPQTMMISITAFGKIPKGKLPKRSDAHPEDCILVSGTIGDSFLGLNLIQSEKCDSNKPLWTFSLSRSERDYLKDRYYHPSPRSALIPVIQDFAHASMDISDGLVGDFLKIARASNLGAKLDIGLDILSSAARSAIIADQGLFDALIRGGDDYEVLFTVAQENLTSCMEKAKKLGVPLTHIGTMHRSDSPVEIRHNGHMLSLGKASFMHF